MPSRFRESSWDCAALGWRWPYSLSLPAGPAPADGWPLIIVLHGAGRSHRSLGDLAGDLPWWQDSRCAVLAPEGALGFWMDSPDGAYAAMLVELIAQVRATAPVSARAEHCAIGGWSMGGYGAMRFAQRHPDLIAAVGSIIGHLDFPHADYPPERNFPVPACFGPPAEWPSHRCTTHAGRLRGMAIGQYVAAQAFDADMNRAFRRELDRLAIPQRYVEVDGVHDWAAVRALLPMMLDFLQERIA